MSVQFQASAKTKKEKLDFIRENFSQVAAKDGDVELLKIKGDAAVYRSGGFTQYGHLDKTQKGSDIFIPDCDIGNLQDDKMDEVYNRVLKESMEKKKPNPFLPPLNDFEKTEELTEPFNPFLPKFQKEEKHQDKDNPFLPELD